MPADPSAISVEAGPLADVLIRILMDEVETEERADEGAYLLRMVKYVAR
jgi:hypothetical protein